MTNDKTALTYKRAELIKRLTDPLVTVDGRLLIQESLRVVNAQLKALNTTEAAQLKAAADRRKAAGMAEAQANAARARARLADAAIGDPEHGPDIPDEHPDPDDPGQAAAIDAWIVAVLRRGGVKVQRARDGALNLFDAPAKWVNIVEGLCAGLHAAARGEELPPIAPEEKAPKAKKRS